MRETIHPLYIYWKFNPAIQMHIEHLTNDLSQLNILGDTKSS